MIFFLIFAEFRKSREKPSPKKRATKKGRAIVKSSKLKPKPIEDVQLGEIVLCKMKGFCEWPARVIAFENGQIVVEFFGDHTTHRTAIKNIFKFEDCSDIIISNLHGRKKPMYSKSIQEAELLMGISLTNSITNRIAS